MSRPRYLTSRTCDLKRLPFADLARDEDVGEELHLDLDDPFAFARLAAAAGHVEREVAGRQPARLRVLGRGEQLADRIERLEIGDRVGSRRAPDRRLVDEDDVGDELGAFELAMRADAAIPVVLGALQRRVDDVVHERALARAADAGHAGQHAERNLDVDVLEVVLRRAEDPQALVGRAAARRRHRDRELVAQVLGGQRARLLQQLLERAREDDAPALLAGAEPHVDHRVGDADHVLVVLDDQHGVPLVAQLAQDRDQPLVVARVQADRRLVEHVERADQRGPERRREVDALRLAARQRRRQPIERQVVEADVAQEAEALADLAEHLVGDDRVLLRERERLEEAVRVLHGQPADDVDRALADADVARFAPQPGAVALRARQVAAIAAEEHADVDLVLLALQPAEEALHAFPAAAVPFDDEALLVLVQLGPRHVEAHALRAPRASARRAARGSAACSTARWRSAGSTSSRRARPAPCPAR